MAIKPNSLPQLSEDRVRQILTQKGVIHKVAILANRGYFRNTLGKPGENDFGIYDDAFFLVGPGIFAPANGNTDPSRQGWNAGVGKPFAVLQDGIWLFRMGPHKMRTPALRQCSDEEAFALGVPNEGEFLVERSWGKGDPRNYLESGNFNINVHSGGENTTSSWGCLTIPPDQFRPWMNKVWRAMLDAGQKVIPVCLTSDILT